MLLALILTLTFWLPKPIDLVANFTMPQIPKPAETHKCFKTVAIDQICVSDHCGYGKAYWITFYRRLEKPCE